MSKPIDENRETAPLRESLAHELGNLHKHFGSSFSTDLGSGTQHLQFADSLVDRRSPLPLDDAYVQQTKDQIRAIVEKIAALAHSPLDPKDFIDSVLFRIANAMGADSVALWHQRSDTDWIVLGNYQMPLSLVTQANESEESPETLGTFERFDLIEAQLQAASSATPPSPSDEPPRPTEAHQALLTAVAQEKQPILISPGNVALTRDRPANPTESILMYAPLPLGKGYDRLWLQVVQSPSGGPSSQRGYLRFVAQMADLMADFFRSHRLRVFERDRDYLSLAEYAMHDLVSSGEPKQGLARLMNILREHAHAEHAFLLNRESFFGQWKVVAAAGLVDIDRRAEGIQQIQFAAKELQQQYARGGALRTEDLTGSVDQRDPDLTRFLNTFAVAELQWIKPLTSDLGWLRNDSMTDDANSSDERPRLVRKHPRRDVALLLTWSGFEKPPAKCREQCGLMTRLGLSALQFPWWKQALVEANPIAVPWSSKLYPTSWSKSLRWLLALVLLGSLLAIPVPMRLHATAVLMPLVQQHVYAPADAIVEEIFVDHGQRVSAGDMLLRLHSPQLSAEYDAVVSQHLRSAQRLADIEARLLRDTTLTSAQRDELEGERESLVEVQPIERKQIELLKKQLDALNVVAKETGSVSTWNLKDNLLGRPVQQGNWLLSIQKRNTQWVLESALPERDAQEFLKSIAEANEPAMVVLNSMPQTSYPIRYMADSVPRIETPPKALAHLVQQQSVLRVRFEIDAESLPSAVAVSGATARITIPSGRGPLIWAFSKDFVQNVWSRLQMWL